MFPSPTGVNHYESISAEDCYGIITKEMFPSPTGVNHYEYSPFIDYTLDNMEDSFRPQQGLTIMNCKR